MSIAVIIPLMVIVLTNWLSVAFGVYMLHYHEELFTSYRLPITSTWGWALATQWVVHSKRIREAIFKPFTGMKRTFSLLSALAFWWFASVQYANGANAMYNFVNNRRYFDRADDIEFIHFVLILPFGLIPTIVLYYVVGWLRK